MSHLARLWKLWLSLSGIYLVMLVLSIGLWFALPAFDQARNLRVACYWTDALVFYVKCQGFAGHDAVQFILNLPFQMLYSPMFGLYGMSDPSAPIESVLYLLGMTALLWAPPLSLLSFWVARYIKRRRSNYVATIH
jgi:hypothetical protein